VSTRCSMSSRTLRTNSMSPPLESIAPTSSLRQCDPG
jgi:hypothetical protein